MLAGAGLSLGFIQLLATPLQDVSALEVQVLAVRTTLFVAPLVVSLLQLLQQGPRLLEEAAMTRRLRRGAWSLRLARTGGMALCSAVLLLYFEAAALAAAVLTRPEADAVAELRYLIGNIPPVLLLILLTKGALFGAIAALLTLRQGWRPRQRHTGLAWRMADAILGTITALLILDLTLVVVMDPLRIAGLG
jgi:hypothetical protein